MIRASVLFDGSPEKSTPSFREFVGRDYEKLPIERFAKWRLASKTANIWSLDLDVAPLVRPKLVYVLAAECSDQIDVDQCCEELMANKSLPIRLFGTEKLTPATVRELRENCVEICDRVIVINTTDEIDDRSQDIIELALQMGKRVAYLNY